MGRQITLFNWARLYGTLPPEARYCALFVYLYFLYFWSFFLSVRFGGVGVSCGFLARVAYFFVCFRFSLYRYCRHEDNSKVRSCFITGLPPFIRTLLAFFLCDVIAMETSMQLPLVLVFFPLIGVIRVHSLSYTSEFIIRRRLPSPDPAVFNRTSGEGFI